eukprot:scaffold3177_cov86-Phaeocystis_antarctica.AAC.4
MPPHQGCSPNLNERCSRSMSARTRRGTPMAQLVRLAADREVDRVDARGERGDGARRDEGVLAVEAAAAAVDVESVQDVVTRGVQARDDLDVAHHPASLPQARICLISESKLGLEACSVSCSPPGQVSKYTSCLALVACSSERRSFVRMASSFFCASASVIP